MRNSRWVPLGNRMFSHTPWKQLLTSWLLCSRSESEQVGGIHSSAIRTLITLVRAPQPLQRLVSLPLWVNQWACDTLAILPTLARAGERKNAPDSHHGCTELDGRDGSHSSSFHTDPCSCAHSVGTQDSHGQCAPHVFFLACHFFLAHFLQSLDLLSTDLTASLVQTYFCPTDSTSAVWLSRTRMPCPRWTFATPVVNKHPPWMPSKKKAFQEKQVCKRRWGGARTALQI